MDGQHFGFHENSRKEKVEHGKEILFLSKIEEQLASFEYETLITIFYLMRN